ncbi:MAG: GHKL domain-containing protein [Lachnospiraceae bacterium]|nr:GHKL domain-containing protein [Lachnospiraceae bacterium]
MIVLCSYKLEIKRLSDFVMKRDKMIFGVSILLLCGFGINFYKMKEKGDISKDIYIQMVYFIFIFLFIIYEWQKSRVEVEKRKAQLEMNQLYYDAYDRLIMLVRERQHDMKNHINAILSMIYTTNNYNELAEKQKEYCGYVMEQNEKTRLVLSVGNPLIAGFIYSKVQEAENNSIKVEYQIEIKKETSVIPEYELVETAGILFDNAMEALNCISESEDAHNQVKSKYISMKETEEQVEIIVANTSNYYEEDMTERFFEAGYSSKGKGRGIGLSKLRRMVHKRKGEVIVSNDLRNGLNYLTFTIIIPKEKRKKSRNEISSSL